MTLGPWYSRRFLFGLAALVILLALLLGAAARLVFSESRIRDEIPEDMIWLSSQGQYEAVRFADALSNFRLGLVTPDELQLRFDLMVSRVAILESGEPRRQVEALGHADVLADMPAVIAGLRDELAGLQPGDADLITDMRERVVPLALAMRDIANAGLLARRDRDALARDDRRRMIFELLLTLGATAFAGLLLAVIYVRDHRLMVTAEATLERERQISSLHRTFISVVSHQFRTPIAIIDSSAQRMIRRSEDMPPEEIASRADKIRNACLRLTRLVESTLNAARLDKGEINFAPRPTDLRAMLELVQEGQPEGDLDRVKLEVGTLPELTLVDPTLLEQAVQNLVSNALKFSPPGVPVTIRTELIGDMVSIAVRDSGVGIPQAEIGQLFQRYFRASTAEGIPGTGIGLSFAAHIASLHGGRVEVASQEGAGSTFSLLFPYRRQMLAADGSFQKVEA